MAFLLHYIRFCVAHALKRIQMKYITNIRDHGTQQQYINHQKNRIIVLYDYQLKISICIFTCKINAIKHQEHISNFKKMYALNNKKY